MKHVKAIPVVMASLLMISLSACNSNTTVLNNADPTTSATTTTTTTSYIEEIVDQLTLRTSEKSDLRFSVNLEAVDLDRISSSDEWHTFLTSSDIIRFQSDTFSENQIACATWSETGLVKPADFTSVNPQTGEYVGEMIPAIAKEDYLQFTVYFRSSKPQAQIVFSSSTGFRIEGDASLLPALTMRVADQSYTQDTIKKGGNICVCSQQVGDYYVGSATFYIYVDGAHEACTNLNAAVNMYLDSLVFSYADA